MIIYIPLILNGWNNGTLLIKSANDNEDTSIIENIQ